MTRMMKPKELNLIIKIQKTCLFKCQIL